MKPLETHLTILFSLALVLAPAIGHAAQACEQEVRFEKGASAATYAGRISGYEFCDYHFTAAAGQTLTVSLAGSHSERITPVLFDPERQVEISGPIKLERGGRHTVRILMPRALARRGEAVEYSLTIGIR